MFRLVDSDWNRELIEASRTDVSSMKIVCPFIKVGALQRLLKAQPRPVQVITRFNLDDFAAGVSDLESLRLLLKIGARVRGVKHLHAKLYLFGNSRAIGTSANLTAKALDRNHEFGFVAENPSIVKSCQAYFSDLWAKSGSDLTIAQIETWDQTVMRYRAMGGRQNFSIALGDFGADANLIENSSIDLPTVVVDAPQAFVKFFGMASSRVDLSHPTIDEIKRSGCHWALTYPKNKRPIGVQDGALMFMSRLTKDRNDIRIFGRATALKYLPGRDDATADDINLRPFKETWSRYIRVSGAEFVAGTMSNGVSLDDLMNELGSDAFAATQRNAKKREGNTNPHRAFMQQAAVKLSQEGLVWLSEKLQKAFIEHGTIQQDELNQLDWPSVPSLDE